MVHAHTVDDDDVALGIVCAQPQDLLIGCRPVPTTRCRQVGEFDDDGGAGPASFEHLDLPAVFDESAPERPQRGVDAPKILDDLLAGAHLTHMRDSVSRHDVLLSTCDGSPLFRAAAPVDSLTNEPSGSGRNGIITSSAHFGSPRTAFSLLVAFAATRIAAPLTACWHARS